MPLTHISAYERDLREKGLSDLPFHASPLMNGHEDYRAFRKNHLNRIRRKVL